MGEIERVRDSTARKIRCVHACVVNECMSMGGGGGGDNIIHT